MIKMAPSDLVFLEMCDECTGGELEILTVIEGRVVPDGEAFKRQAESMVRRGYFERVSSGGSRSRAQGARLRCVYRRTEAGEVALAALRRVRELEAKLGTEKRAAAPARRAGPRSPHPA